VFLAFSIDETIQLHEFVGVQTDALLPGGTRVSTLFSETGLFFLVVGVPAAILVGVLLAAVRPFLRVPEGAFRKVVIAVSMMFIGAVAVDFLANFVEVRSAPALVLVYVEESLEMAGASVMLWAGHALVAAPVSPRDG
jgi:hypothetical protein